MVHLSARNTDTETKGTQMKALFKIALFVGALVYMFAAIASSASGQEIVGYSPVKKTFVNQLYRQGVIKPTPGNLAVVRPSYPVYIPPASSVTEIHAAGTYRALGAGGFVASRTVIVTDNSQNTFGGQPPFAYYSHHGTVKTTEVHVGPHGKTVSKR